MTADESADEVRVRLRFPEGGAVLEYRASAAVAHRLSVELGRYGVSVTVDDQVHAELASLPNTELWSR